MRQQGLYEFWPSVSRPGRHASFLDTEGVQRGLYEFWPSVSIPRVSVMSLTVQIRQQIYLEADIFTAGFIWMGPKISLFDVFDQCDDEWESRCMSLNLLLTSRQIRLEVQSLLWSNNVVVCRTVNPGDLFPLRQHPRLISSLRRLVIYYSGPMGNDELPLCRWASSFAPPWNLPNCNNHGMFKAGVAVNEFSEALSEILRNKAPCKLELGLVLDIDDDYGERT